MTTAKSNQSGDWLVTTGYHSTLPTPLPVVTYHHALVPLRSTSEHHPPAVILVGSVQENPGLYLITWIRT